MNSAILQACVIALNDEAEDIRAFTLAAANGKPLPVYEPGAHVDVHLGEGLVRQYSLCNVDRHDGSYRIAVKREPASRGGSQQLHERIKVGDLLGISQPRSAFALAPAASRHLLMAGGIGITPLLAMAYELAARGEDFHLAYFCRDRAAVAFAAELAQSPLAGRSEILCGLSVEESTAVIARLLDDASPGTHCYTCGPAPFMNAVRERAAITLPSGHFHQESFGPAEAVSGTAFMLRLQRSGRDIQVAESQSAVDAMRAAGVDIETSCEVGVCGTCLTRVLEGCPDHQDSFLSAAEQTANTCFTPCVSRSRTAMLVVDA